MSRRQLAWFMAMAMLTFLAAVSAPAFPQEPATDEAAEEQQGESTVETILREQEAALSGEHFAYLPEGRRDPFRSLLVPDLRGVNRPPGAAGMTVAELNLAGVVHDQDGGSVAMVIGSDNKGYFLRVGDQVFDGTVIAVDTRQGLITFRQKVDDPRLIKPYRDVSKRLVPLDEETSNE